jgi:hypothetical protein
VKHRIGCILFSVIGIAWSGWVGLLLLFSHFGDCADDQVCQQMQDANAMHNLLYGLAGGALIWIAYAAWKRFFEGKDV